MKNILLLFTVLSIIVIITPGCDKKKAGCNESTALNYDPEAELYDGSCIWGGTGGTVTLVAKPQHHGMPIISGSGGVADSAYVKFNVSEFPGPDPLAYNLRLAGEDGEDHVHIPGLKPGKYFIYMTGFDTSSNEVVKGGIPVNIPNGYDGEMVIIVPVTE
jgi:hypothetical protein